MNLKACGLLAAAACLVLDPLSSRGQGTAFTYQGQLASGGEPASGTYDFRTTIYDSASLPTNVIAGPLTNSAIAVSNGLFTITPDFGGGVFTGAPRWLEIAVRTNGAAGFVTLSARQLLTPTPYAITAGGVVTGGLSAGAYGNALSFNNPANRFTGAFSGSGAGLTNLAGALTWQVVSGLAAQAAPNTAYLVTNTSQAVTVTLPAAPNIGDRMAVGCSGYGWQLAQNAGQLVLANNVLGPLAPWTQSLAPASPSANWVSAVSSPDGLHLAISGKRGIDVSADGGATWTSLPGGQPDAYLCESADGSRLALAAPAGGGIYLSTDFGTNFTEVFTNSLIWSGMTCSSDASHFAAVANTGGIYASLSYGSNWFQSATAPVTNWTGLASSTDGSHLVAVALGGAIYLSSDFGSNWTPSAGAPTNSWTAAASSADGSRLLAAGGAQVYVSNDSGATWLLAGAPSNGWLSAASSADGTHLAVGSDQGQGLWLSTDAGATWGRAATPYLTSTIWRATACSAAGTFVAGEYSRGGVYVLKSTTTAGPAGYLSGGADSAVELEYVGGGQFLPLSHEGTLLVH
ncbi:MAG TPA: hypothetical protein VMU04_00290 [Candidatus Acidoferrum sp.]|nr:hypothetical protein [Candidatus Acidoferrum sp.]